MVTIIPRQIDSLIKLCSADLLIAVPANLDACMSRIGMF